MPANLKKIPPRTTNAKQLAQARGGRCLGCSSTKSPRAKLVWRCAKGHTWEARADSVQRGTWCPQCSRDRQKNTIDEMRLIAKRRGGECLSRTYVNTHSKLKWKCTSGHIFEATSSHVKQGEWCRQCGVQSAAKQKRLPMSEIVRIAESRNGRCLSNTYSPNAKLKWQCDKGHVWEALIHSVKRGSWCPICGHRRSGRKPLSLEEMRQIAASHGGTCLSTKYTNTDTKLQWRCRNGHTWWALPSSVKKNHWCARCAGMHRLSLRHAQRLARERGGKCLSRRYGSSHSKLKWQCVSGHIWHATYSNVAWGRWCRECSLGIGERICRAYFEQMFGHKFPKSRPHWLINREKFQMELDGYSRHLGLAFEHQGRQHQVMVDAFQTVAQFNKRKRDDRFKRMLCKRHGVTLIEVLQIPDSLPVDEIQHFVLKQCRNMSIELKRRAERATVSLLEAYAPRGREWLRAIREAARMNGGTCLSSSYLGQKFPLRFRCSEGHEWATLPHLVLKGHWCQKCAAARRGRARRLTLKEMQKLAASKGGRCLSKTYLNANTNLLWECAEKHRWRAIPNSVKRGSWCPMCWINRRRNREKR